MGNAVGIIRKAYSDNIITLAEAKGIEAEVLSDGTIDEAEVRSLQKLLHTSTFEPAEHDLLLRLRIASLADAPDANVYWTYHHPLLDTPPLQKKIFWTYKNSELNPKLDANADGKISMEDVLLYKHPRLENKPDCFSHHRSEHELPYNFAYPQWESLVYFLRGKILEGNDSLQSVRQFMTDLYHEDYKRFEYVLDSFNVHLENPPPNSYSEFAMIAIEASIARVVGAKNFSKIYETSTDLTDLEIPLFIQNAGEEDPDTWAAQTSTGIENGAYRVYITLFSNREGLREKSDAVQHEIRHALINQLRGEKRHNLPLLIREPLANYWDEGDGKKELRRYLANTGWMLTPHYIHQIYEKLIKGDFDGKVSDEHFEGNVLFYFFERHYGIEGLRRFCHSILPEAGDENDNSLLEKASQAMAGKSWSEVLDDFKGEGAHYIKELKSQEGGADFEAIIQSYFGLSWADWFNASKVNELRLLPPDARQELKVRLQEILESHSDSVYAPQISYLLGQLAMFEENFSEARAWFFQVEGEQKAASYYAIVWSHVMEGNIDQAMRITQQIMLEETDNPLLSVALEDLVRHQGSGLYSQYFNFYHSHQPGEIPYRLGDE